MLYQLHTNHVAGYTMGQKPIVYLVARISDVVMSKCKWLFTDGHAYANLTTFYNDYSKLRELDWDSINEVEWYDTTKKPDRQRRKQAEFMIHEYYPWSLIAGIAVIDTEMKNIVESILDKYDDTQYKPVVVKREWYY